MLTFLQRFLRANHAGTTVDRSAVGRVRSRRCAAPRRLGWLCAPQLPRPLRVAPPPANTTRGVGADEQLQLLDPARRLPHRRPATGRTQAAPRSIVAVSGDNDAAAQEKAINASGSSVDAPGNDLVLVGRVLPERAAVTISEIAVEIGVETGTTARARIRVGASQVIVRVDGTLGPDVVSARNGIRDAVSGFVDVLGFAQACAYTVELDVVAGDDLRVLGVQFVGEELAEAEARSFRDEAFRVLFDVRDGVFLRHALADYRRAIREPLNTTFHAFRAVECLTYRFGRNNRLGRPRFLSALNISDKWLVERLEKPGGEARHGKFRSTSENDRRTCLSATREVVLRFVALSARSLERLPQTEFPLLEPD